MFISTNTAPEGGAKILAGETMTATEIRARARVPQPSQLKDAPRCQAQRRRMPGVTCRSPAVKGKRVCRIHGGGKGSGGRKGKANGAYRHGGFTQEAIEERRWASDMLRRISDGELGQDSQPPLVLLRLLGIKETRAERRVRNKAAWKEGDRTAWGGEDRRGWPMRPGRNGYRRQRKAPPV